jgi:pimeloyl-ACP methyl ester carboxylesterase
VASPIPEALVPSAAPPARRFVSLDSSTSRQNPVGYHACQGIWVAPAGARPRTALIATHYNVDFSEHYLGPFMAERGYGFLGWNTRFRGAEPWFLLEHALVDIGAGVRWLREEAGVETVVLLGNSGGGSLMGAYQSQALAPSIRPGRGLPLPPAALELPPADYYVSLNAHQGRPEVLTAWFDPSVSDERDPTSVDAKLDMYRPENGPPYSPEFVSRYRRAQEARNHRITEWAIAELERLAARGVSDRLFNLYRTWADLRLLDGSLDPSDRPVGQCYAGDPRRANYSPFGIGTSNTLRTWLSMWSLRESDCCGAPHLRRITQPSLVIQSLADTGCFPSDARAIHESLGASDKRLDLIPGDHYLVVPTPARAEVANRIATWLTDHSV